MAVRPIDGNELVDTLKQIVSDYTSHGMYPSAFPVEYAIEIVEKMPTLTPPNEALTIEQLREIDGEPVWIKRLKGLSVCDTGWAVVDVCPNQIRVWWFGSEVEDKPSEKDYGETWLAYRRPPERQEDT